VLRQSLVRVDFVDGQLDLPAVMVGAEEVQRWRLLRIEQGGEEAMGFLVAGARGVRQGVDEHPHEQMVPVLAACLLGRINVRPIGAIRQAVAHAQADACGDTDQDMGCAPSRLFKQLEAVEATVQEQQHPRTDAAQQPHGPHPLTGVAGPEPGVHHRMGAALAQVDALHLGEGAGAAVALVSAEGARIGRRVGHVLGGAVQRHQAQAEAEGTGCLGRGQGPAHRLEERHHGAGTQARAGLRDGSFARQDHIRVGPEQAQAMHQLGQDYLQGIRGPQAHRQTQQQRDVRRQLAAAHRRHDGLRGGRLDQGRRHHALQCLQRNRIGELGAQRPLTYPEAQEMTPFGSAWLLVFW
jgi:hypothetical protein